MHGTTKFSSCSPPLVLQSALVIFGDSLVFAIITEEVGDISSFYGLICTLKTFNTPGNFKMTRESLFAK